MTKIRNLLGAGVALVALLLSSGCGGGSSANVITITITSSVGTNLILGQSTTLTATVSGATNTNVNWQPCMYTTTTTDSTGKSTTSALKTCPPDPNHTPSDPNFTIFGSLTNEQTTGTATFTAVNTLPDPKTYPGLAIVITAQSAQDTSKTGKITLTLNSGIGLLLTPVTATVPTGEPQQFNVQLTNDLQDKKVTWSLTQQIPTTTTGSTPNPYTPLATCSPSCGTITPDANNANVALYTAPTTVPTAITPAQKNNTNPPADVTIVAVSNADNTRFVIGTITITQGGPITFNGISPTIAPQGAFYWDIYLDAPNISSASFITLTDANGGSVTKHSDSGQIKILFPIPTTTTSGTTTTTTNPTPTGARLRLFGDDLHAAGPFTISVTDPAQTCNGIPAGTACTATGTGTFNIIPVRPTSIASVPDDVVQGALAQQTRVIIDGGYFGPGGSANGTGSLANVIFQSTAVGQDPNNPSTAQKLNTLLSTSQINSGNPGLYPLSVTRTVAPLPAQNNPSVTNIAIFPDYSVSPPAVTSGPSGFAAGTNPTAIDIDPTLGIAVVAETGSNGVQFYQIASASLIPIDSNGSMCAAGCPVAVANTPTGLSINRSNHTVAVISYGTQTTTTTNSVCSLTSYTGQTVTVLNVPGNPNPITPFTVDLSGALQGSVCPAPMPYSIGVDQDSNLALVAYSSVTSSSITNLGFVVNLNPNTADATGKPTNPYGCILGQAIDSTSNKYGQCLFSQVTLNTGTYPRIATSPHGHLAIVTPGGSGVVRGVDVRNPSSANIIESVTLAAGIVTVTVNTNSDATSCPPGVQPPIGQANCRFTMVPGNAGTVLISGVPKGANGTDFNGTFPVAVTSSNSFTYALTSTVGDSASKPSGACTSGATVPCPAVFYGTPDQLYAISATLQGVAVNPITNTAAFADANATGQNGPQIDLLSALDQSVSSVTFSANCTAFISTCASAPELLPTADVAWQPFTNEIVSYNPHLNQVSVSDPVSHRRYAIVTLGGTGTATLTVQNGTTNANTLNLFGGLAVDPVTNQAFVVKSGSGTIDVIDLGGPNTATPIKPTHISQLLVPSPTPGPGIIGGIRNASVPQATLTSSNPLSGVQIFGSGFASGLQVLLDGVDIATHGGTVDKIASNGREVDVTIPPFFLSAPHHYSLTVLSGGAPSNSVDFLVIQSVNMAGLCLDSMNNPINTMPTSVAIADQLANGPFSPIAVVTNQGCNSISIIDINPSSATFGQLLGSPISVGTAPQGIAISQRRGLAVIANHGANTASLIDLTKSPPAQAVPDVNTGTSPVGVAIDDPTGVAITANNGSNTITLLNFALLYPSSGTPPTTLTPISIGGIQSPLAVAIDPDRGVSNQGIAVVTSVQLSTGSAPLGALAVVEIGQATPALSQTIPSGSVSGTPTGIVFDPAIVTGTANPGVFFANSSGTNIITEFNPDTGGGSSVSVGINPTSLAINPQTGALLTANSASNTVSVVDILSNPFKTHQTLGIPGSPTFGVAIDQFTNLAVIVDQANQRVLLFPMPN